MIKKKTGKTPQKIKKTAKEKLSVEKKVTLKKDVKKAVKEKKVTMMFVMAGPFFFTFGGLFCYFLVLPLGLKFLLNYGSEYWKMQVTIGFYFSFVVKLILAFAFAFQIKN